MPSTNDELGEAPDVYAYQCEGTGGKIMAKLPDGGLMVIDDLMTTETQYK